TQNEYFLKRAGFNYSLFGCEREKDVVIKTVAAAGPGIGAGTGIGTLVMLVLVLVLVLVLLTSSLYSFILFSLGGTNR
ncbi:hypothetical protein M0804_015037, partial [Polistes exclamans]